jgi:hypothetical protein
MKRPTIWIAGSIACVGLLATPLLAQRGGGMGQGGGMGRSGGFGRSNTHTVSPDAGKNPSELLVENTTLSSKLGSLLPEGTNVQQAAVGFKSLGEFASAVHVAHNLGIPFDSLKGKMVGPDAVSLGKAIQELKPDEDSKAEVKKAKHQAEQDLKESKA